MSGQVEKRPYLSLIVPQVEKYVLQMRGGVSAVLTGVSSYGQMPLPLIHLMSALTKLQLFIQGLKSGVDMAAVLFADTGTKGIQIFFILLMCLITPIFYQVK